MFHFEMTDYDKYVYETELKDFLPDKLIVLKSKKNYVWIITKSDGFLLKKKAAGFM